MDMLSSDNAALTTQLPDFHPSSSESCEEENDLGRPGWPDESERWWQAETRGIGGGNPYGACKFTDLDYLQQT